ncbi:hypothetical protein JXD38_03425 [candidate division WOR-3 bacterium]|nr:hypothetical protein [candidate division WOR-3 bacterium]
MKDHERAMQVWSVLIWAASNRQLLTYKTLGKLVGVPAHGLAHILDHVALYCRHKDFPSLTAIVIRKDAGKPGSGFWAAKPGQIAKAIVEVHEYDWIGRAKAPTPELLERLRSEAGGAGTPR